MRRAHLVWALGLSACAAIGSSGKGDTDLPTAGVGPFRKLDGDETLGIAPFVMDDRTKGWRDPSALAVDPASSDPRVFLYLAGTIDTREVIARTRADDGRSFFGGAVGTTPQVVLRAETDGELVRAPCAARVLGKILLYWADGQGIRVATSDDGLAFTRQPARALDVDPEVAWERTPPGAPSVAVYPDGRIRMIYAAGGYLGEAESADGLTFTRIALDPIFGPSPVPDPSTLGPGEKPPLDDGRIDDPWLAPRITPAGRLHIRVLYTGIDATDAPSIGLAARYGDSGPLSRQAQPVYSVNKLEEGPTLFEWPGGSLLYVGQDRAPSANTHYSAIAAAYAPANLRLPAATAYADSP